MKQFILIGSTIILGSFIFYLVAGEDDDSILSVVKEAWMQEIEERTIYP